jgi:hypothetical protein
MSKWLLRGLVFAALMVVVRLVQGTLINQFETKALIISVVAVAVFAIAALVWGLSDGRADARANPDPDRRNDLAMTWLVAGLVAGLLSGVVCWVLSFLYAALYVGGLINELTTFAAFTALLVFLPAITAVAVGRWLVDRKAPPVERKQHGQERPDGDVFSAFRDDAARDDAARDDAADDDARTTELPIIGAGETEPRPSAVALAERDTETTTETHPDTPDQEPNQDRPKD